MDLNSIWNSFLEKIKNEIATISYETWFAETKLISLKDNTATVLVPYHSQKKMLIENYKDIIEEIFTEVTGTNFKFDSNTLLFGTPIIWLLIFKLFSTSSSIT